MRSRLSVPSPVSANSGRRRRLVVTAVLLCLVAAAAYVSVKGLRTSSIDAGTPPASVPELSADERAYYEFVAPRLLDLSAQSQALGNAAAAKSRNLLDIQARGDRVRTLVRELDGYTDQVGTPARFAAATVAYRAGAEYALVAMREAQQGFLRLDWDRVAASVPTFAAGTDQFNVAVNEIEKAGSRAGGSMGTPSGR